MRIIISKEDDSMSDKQTKQKAYLYSMWNNELVMKEGYIDYTKFYYRNDRVPFHIDGHYKTMCGREPGFVYNGFVWLTERDDELARRIFIGYEEMRIADLERQLENHKQKIKILKESPL